MRCAVLCERPNQLPKKLYSNMARNMMRFYRNMGLIMIQQIFSNTKLSIRMNSQQNTYTLNKMKGAMRHEIICCLALLYLCRR